MCIAKRRERTTYCVDYNSISLNDKQQQLVIDSVTTWGSQKTQVRARKKPKDTQDEFIAVT